MNQAYTQLAAYKENEYSKEKEHNEKVRIKVEALKQSLAEKDKTIDELKRQLEQVSGLSFISCK
jgi:predicted RNase H-like nuclease (RuvC/YqgF family)